MTDNLSTVSDAELKAHNQTKNHRPTSSLTSTALIYGAVAGLLMSVFISVSGFYITGENAGFGFFKFLILGVALFLLLTRTKAATKMGGSVKNGIKTGMMASMAAGVVSAIVVLLFNDKTALSNGIEDGSQLAINQFTLAGISFFECLVAGLILSLIFLQFLKDPKPAK